MRYTVHRTLPTSAAHLFTLSDEGRRILILSVLCFLALC